MHFPFKMAVFHLITLFLKDFLVLSDLLKPAFEKSNQIIKNLEI